MSDDAAGAADTDGGQQQSSDPPAEAKDQKEGKSKPDEQADEEDEEPSLGAPSQDFRQAYDRGRISLRGPGATYLGAGRDVHISETINLVTGRGVALAPGPVRPEDLELIRSRYTPIVEYERILATLTERRLVLLRGFPNTGRATTALKALDEITRGTVFRIDVEDLSEVGEDILDAGGGYLIDLTDQRIGQSVAQPQLDRLSYLLGKRRCFGVLLIGRHHGFLDGYLHDCSPPDPDGLLRGYIMREMRADDKDGLEDRLLELAGQPRMREALGGRPRPVEILAFATLLVQHGRGEITLEDIEADCAGFVRRQVAEWFASLRGLRRSDAADHALRLAGFRIALAVFNESPYYIVREAGERLALEFMKTLWPERIPGRPLTGDDQETWLEAARAKLVDGFMTKGIARIPVKFVGFEDLRFPHAVLSHVWLTHHNAREPLRRWLEEQSQDQREFVWVRAAQAAGLLCSLDYPYTFHNVIAPAAKSGVRSQREFAAVALDQAAQDEEARPIITAHLKSWVRGEPGEQWTVARALGYELGLGSIDKSLNWLRTLGTRTETMPEMKPPYWSKVLLGHVANSMARLFAAGAAEPVLDRLQEWIRPRERRSLQDLAAWTILNMASLYVDDLLQLNALLQRRDQLAPAPERKQWPVLLAMQAEDTEFTAPIADLLRHALRSSLSGKAQEKLEGWFRAGEDDRTCVDALVRFLPNLVHNEGDRRRLLRLIAKLRRDWASPLDDDIAIRAETALDHVLILEVAQ